MPDEACVTCQILFSIRPMGTEFIKSWNYPSFCIVSFVVVPDGSASLSLSPIPRTNGGRNSNIAAIHLPSPGLLAALSLARPTRSSSILYLTHSRSVGRSLHFSFPLSPPADMSFPLRKRTRGRGTLLSDVSKICRILVSFLFVLT